MTEGAFEARKISYRQTKEGVAITFLVHPNDINAALAVAPLGTIYAIGFREMPEGDTTNSADSPGPRDLRKVARDNGFSSNNTPQGESRDTPLHGIQESASPEADAGHGIAPSDAPAEAVAAGAPLAATKPIGVGGKQRRHFSELPRSAQAALMCGNPVFQRWILPSSVVDAGHEVDDRAAEMVRVECIIGSRAQLDSHEQAAKRWDELLFTFRRDTGQVAEERG